MLYERVILINTSKITIFKIYMLDNALHVPQVALLSIFKMCFAASITYGTISAASYGTPNILGTSTISLLGSLGARGFNSLGKYTFHIGSIASGQIPNISPANISEFLN